MSGGMAQPRKNTGSGNDGENSRQRTAGQDFSVGTDRRSQAPPGHALNMDVRGQSTILQGHIPSPIVHSNPPAALQAHYSPAGPHESMLPDHTFNMAQLSMALPPQSPAASWVPASPPPPPPPPLSQISHVSSPRWISPGPVFPSPQHQDSGRPDITFNPSSQPYHPYQPLYQPNPPMLPMQMRPRVHGGYVNSPQPGDFGGLHVALPPDTRAQSSNPYMTSPNMARRSPLEERGAAMVRPVPFSGSLSGITVARGPPRKPRQSGHALWVGNLPPAVTIIDLKEHFSRDATQDIQSIKLITKTNCAFVNYRSHESCSAALTRFHDSLLQDRRLVCRLRRGSTNEAGSDLGSRQQGSHFSRDQQASGSSVPWSSQNYGHGQTGEEASKTGFPKQRRAGLPERFFILKSLTNEDLEISCQDGVWATQSHNESTLDEAYQSSTNVYLFFSVNKSSEYFGYARMASEIGKVGTTTTMTMSNTIKMPDGHASDSATYASSASASLERTQGDALALTNNEEVGIRYIITEAVKYAPSGIVIDDVARDIVFWEADLLDEDEDDDDDASAASPDGVVPKSDPAGDRAARNEKAADEPAIVSSSPSTTTTIGSSDNLQQRVVGQGQVQQSQSSSFRVDWLSTTRVPFHRTRGLRNPWNSNREIKIARDGTEVETNVARQLLAMFHSVPGA